MFPEDGNPQERNDPARGRPVRLRRPLGAMIVATLLLGAAVAVWLVTAAGGDSERAYAATSSQLQARARARALVWRPPSRASWRADAAQSARHFAANVGIRTSGMTVTMHGAGSAVLKRRGHTIGTVVLARDASGVWGVVGAMSPRLDVRFPQPGDRFDPPLSVAFRSQDDGDILVSLYETGKLTPIASWQDDVDAGVDWYAHENFDAADADGYVTLEHRTRGAVDALSVVPVRLGKPAKP